MPKFLVKIAKISTHEVVAETVVETDGLLTAYAEAQQLLKMYAKCYVKQVIPK